MPADEMRERIAASVRLPIGPEISWDLLRATVHWLSIYRELTVQRYGCPPDGLVVAIGVYAEAIAGGDSRRRETNRDAAPEVLALGRATVIDLEEAAEMLKVKPDSVRDLCRRGVLAAEKRRNRWFPLKAAVMERVAMREES